VANFTLLRSGPWDEAPRAPLTESFQDYLKKLHPIRRYVINAILPMVLESRYEDAKTKMSPPQDGRDAKFKLLGMWPSPLGGTSCGLLPHFVLAQLGASNGFGWPVQGLPAKAREMTPIPAEADKLRQKGLKVVGCWVSAGQGALPLPGDIYGLVDGGDVNGQPSHVGVIVDPRSNAEGEWITADSGQGQKPDQAALYCPRRWCPSTGKLSGSRFRNGNKTPTEQGKERTLAGWISLELVNVSAKARSLAG
jgi:hypothetical protein